MSLGPVMTANPSSRRPGSRARIVSLLGIGFLEEEEEERGARAADLLRRGGHSAGECPSDGIITVTFESHIDCARIDPLAEGAHDLRCREESLRLRGLNGGNRWYHRGAVLDRDPDLPVQALGFEISGLPEVTEPTADRPFRQSHRPSDRRGLDLEDRKSTRLNSSHLVISYA